MNSFPFPPVGTRVRRINKPLFNIEVGGLGTVISAQDKLVRWDLDQQALLCLSENFAVVIGPNDDF